MGYHTSRGRVTERTVEVPWVLERLVGYPVLDIGSCGAEYLRHLPPGSVGTDVRPLDEAYLRADCHFARCSATALPFADGSFGQVLLVSTLEHIGCPSDHYGTVGAGETWHKLVEQVRAFRECVRVLRPGGTLLLTLPYGKAEDLGWQLVYDARGLRGLISNRSEFRPGIVRPWVVEETTFYRAPGDGPYEPCAAEDLVDVPYQYEPGGSRADGVACVVLRKT